MLLAILAYLGGVLTIFSPCILPVLPFVFSRANGPFLKNGLPLLIGMAATFALVSSLAAIGGGWAVKANEVGRWVALIFLTVVALTLLFPALADRLTRPIVALGNRLSNETTGKSGLWSSVLLGVATGLLWAPCAGPILGLILTAAALKGASAGTTLLLLAYALGAGTSLAFVLLAGGKAMAAFKKTRTAEEWTRRVLGALVLVGVVVVAFGLDRGILTKLSGPRTNSFEDSLIAKLDPAMMPKAQAAPADVANLPVIGTLPGFPGGGPWFNSPPLTADDLKGKVVLVDFWTYSCINCLRTLPYVEAWADRYRDQGLVVIGVHSPEFAFEKVQSNVQKAIKDLGVDYPVVMDNDLSIWKAFNNQYWPAHYFIDAKGQIRYEHAGEGDYDHSEAVIRALLAERNGTAVSGAMANIQQTGVKAGSDLSQIFSPETYLGYSRAQNNANLGGEVQDKTKSYALPAGALTLNQWALAGPWTVGAEQASTAGAGAKVRFRFKSRDLDMVLGAAKPGVRVNFHILVDGKPPGDMHGVDVDAGGGGAVSDQRLYQLVRQTGVGEHDFEIDFDGAGAQGFTFTFG